jgi:hypothetical protein
MSPLLEDALNDCGKPDPVQGFQIETIAYGPRLRSKLFAKANDLAHEQVSG